MNNEFGKLLRRFRIDAKLTLNDLAFKMGWTAVYQSDIERGRRNPPNKEKIYKLAKFLGKDSSSLLDAKYKEEGKIELSLIDKEDTIVYLGFILSRNWDNLDNESARKIIDILHNELFDLIKDNKP
jgi:transcriptional regulator with XRE-family HTH domain